MRWKWRKKRTLPFLKVDGVGAITRIGPGLYEIQGSVKMEAEGLCRATILFFEDPEVEKNESITALVPEL